MPGKKGTGVTLVPEKSELKFFILNFGVE